MLEDKLVRQKFEFEETIKKIDKGKIKRAQSSANVMVLGFGNPRATSIPLEVTPKNTEEKDALTSQKKKDFLKRRAISSNNVGALAIRTFGSS